MAVAFLTARYLAPRSYLDHKDADWMEALATSVNCYALDAGYRVAGILSVERIPRDDAMVSFNTALPLDTDLLIATVDVEPLEGD